MKNNLEIIKERFKDSFDVKYREINGPLGKTTLVFIDNLCSTQFLSDYIVSPIRSKKVRCQSLEDLITNVLEINIANFVENKTSIDDAMLHIVSGDVVIFVEGYEEMIYCEVKGYVRRGVGVPLTESVVKGPREGFNELFVDNIALIRRRIKNPDLKFEPIYVGDKSQTVVCVAYIKEVAPDNLINYIKSVIKNMDMEFILDTNYVESQLRESNSAFDTIGYTEKPDEAASKIMEGRVAVLVDGTPFVITAPYFFIENFQAPDDYYLNKTYTNFTRVIRWMAFVFATFIPSMYVAIITYHPSLIPSLFLFRLAVSRAGVPLSTVVEVLVMIFAFQIIKEAGLRLPQPIGGAMSIVAALILGDAAVGAGIASRITIIVVALSTLSYFLVPKLYGALSIWSVIFVIVAGFYGLPGVFITFLIFLTRLADLKSTGYSYLFPIGSIDTFKFKDVIYRGRLDRISKKIIGEGKEYEKEWKKNI
ncbi:spore germination protein [Clostridium sardiniense]|uniref:Spore germination protein n=1 Tax=Clostridium sardiniense TaxID=29369 RepID=A0ABS7KT29_CLOSR|nr:spore germination protein [Clostridium sardiniense]MBM7833099.1 spore germination protein [Clostridium sardiniense]MBY0753966.1 spore germination protein [Clostridium sardiniense]MDQ0459518.1 spore germination protein [Clostridium sardiniense]